MTDMAPPSRPQGPDAAIPPRSALEEAREGLTWLAENGVHEYGGEPPHDGCAPCFAASVLRRMEEADDRSSPRPTITGSSHRADDPGQVWVRMSEADYEALRG